MRRFPELPYSYVHPFMYRFMRTEKTDGWREEFERRALSMPQQFRDQHTRMLLIAEGDIEGWLLTSSGHHRKMPRNRATVISTSVWATGPSATPRARVRI